MRIQYNTEDDVLLLVFSDEPIVKEASHGWHVHVGYGASGLAEITILEAKAQGYWPIENAHDLA